MSDTVVGTSYELQNDLGGGWEYLTSYGSQQAAEQALHRTGPFEGLAPMITVDNPRWRIVKVEQIERSTVVANVSAVLQGDRLALTSPRAIFPPNVDQFLDDLEAGGTTNMEDDR